MNKNDGGPAFPCSRCNEPALRIQGHQWLCEKHYRFGQMRAKAKQTHKAVPSYPQLEAMCKTDLLCADCHLPMCWIAAKGTEELVATLQHYRDGSMALVCRSCNSRHGSMKGDTYRDMPKDHKQCPQCGVAKPFSLFSADNGRSGKMKLKSWCLACSSAAHTKWQKENKDDYNTKQRAYRSKRKADGNPVASGS